MIRGLPENSRWILELPLSFDRFNASCHRAASEVLEEAVADDLLQNMQEPRRFVQRSNVLCHVSLILSYILF